MAEQDKPIPTALRDSRGHFLPGQQAFRGHPAVGKRHHPTRGELIAAALEQHRPELVDRLLGIALQGDMADTSTVRALEVALSRLAPKPKDSGEMVAIPGLADAVTLEGKARAVIEAVAAGEVSADAGQRVLQLLEIYRKAVAHDDMETRLRALEAAGGAARPVVEADPVIDFEDMI